ncbi:MAG: CBS domain-containing protein [Acidobacteriota bacterium]
MVARPTPAIYTISEQSPVSEVAAAMTDSRVHRLFVTDDDCLTGIITTLDILKLLRE